MGYFKDLLLALGYIVALFTIIKLGAVGFGYLMTLVSHLSGLVHTLVCFISNTLDSEPLTGAFLACISASPLIALVMWLDDK